MCQITEYCWADFDMGSKVAALEMKLADLEKDRDRLDWLDANSVDVEWMAANRCDLLGCDGIDSRGKTIREAIDKANP
jgi:hypothetical protein